jgi:hypothetical protein
MRFGFRITLKVTGHWETFRWMAIFLKILAKSWHKFSGIASQS